MPREFKRADRVSDAMQRSIAGILRSEIRDPRIGMANINGVQIPNDLSTAKIFVTFIGVEEQKKIDEAIAVLNDASGFIRSLVARDVKMRSIPKLTFIYDRVVVEGQKLSNLIDKAVAGDSKSEAEE